MRPEQFPTLSDTGVSISLRTFSESHPDGGQAGSTGRLRAKYDRALGSIPARTEGGGTCLISALEDEVRAAGSDTCLYAVSIENLRLTCTA